MGLFDFRKQEEKGVEQQTQDASTDLSTPNEPIHRESVASPPEIPEHIFIEHKRPTEQPFMEPQQPLPDVNDLRTLFQFLEQNLEKKGYEDALMNPDTSFMDEYIKYVNNELDLMIVKVKSYYDNHLRDINFHIETRKRNGMVETVDELMTHRATVDAEVLQVKAIEEDSKKGNGLSQNLFLSYKRGFKNGFAAITYNTILGRRG